MNLAANLLRGLLAQNLTSLSQLRNFNFDADLRCAPGNAAFRTWLAGIGAKPPDVKICRACDLPLVMR